jgi:hypothetical protein
MRLNFLIGTIMLAGGALSSQPAAARDSDKFYTGGRGGWTVEGTFRGDHGRPICTGRSPSGRPFISISRDALEPPTPADDALSLMVSAYQKTSFSHGQKFLVTGTFSFREENEDRSDTYQLNAVALKAGNGDTLYGFAVPTLGTGDGAPMFLVDITRSFTFTLNVPDAAPVTIDLTGSNAAMHDIIFSCPRAYKKGRR